MTALASIVVAVATAPAAAGFGGAWRPFLDPLPLGESAWWLTLLPLALGIAVVYKAVRVKTMRKYWKYVLMMAAQIVGGMFLIAIGVHVVVEWVLPLLERQ